MEGTEGKEEVGERLIRERERGMRWVFVCGRTLCLRTGFSYGYGIFIVSLSLLMRFLRLWYLLSLSGGHRLQ